MLQYFAFQRCSAAPKDVSAPSAVAALLLLLPVEGWVLPMLLLLPLLPAVLLLLLLLLLLSAPAAVAEPVFEVLLLAGHGISAALTRPEAAAMLLAGTCTSSSSRIDTQSSQALSTGRASIAAQLMPFACCCCCCVGCMSAASTGLAAVMAASRPAASRLNYMPCL
jgi:hypothetical protein